MPANAELKTLQQQLAVLKQAQPDGPVSVRIHFIETLLQRAQNHRENVRSILVEKAANALQQLQTEQQPQATVASAPDKNKTHPLQTLTQLLVQEKPVSTENSRGLAFDEFLRQQETDMVQSLIEVVETPAAAEETANPFGELKSSRLFRQAQLQQFADDLVQQAIQSAPENPGPLNPQMLAIRSLTFMRDISPHYMHRFVSYIDTLFWLEQAEDSPPPKAKEKAGKRKKS